MLLDRRRCLWLAAGSALALVGCASSSIPLERLPKPPVIDLFGQTGVSGLVLIARDDGAAGSALDVEVSIDGRSAGVLKPGQVLRLRLPATRTILLFTERFASVDVAIRPELPPGSQVARINPVISAQRRPTSLETVIEADTEILIRLGYDDRGAFSAWRSKD